MKRKQVYEDRIDRKARLTQRNRRNEIRDSETDKYLAEEENLPSIKRAARHTGNTDESQYQPFNKKEIKYEFI